MTAEAPFDLDAVVSLARSKRERPIGCRVEGKPLIGSFNRVVMLRFDDGTKWVFRTPRRERTGQNLPSSLLSKLIASETATLNFLASHSTIPVPKVIDYDPCNANSVGVPYILMTCATGTSFSAFLRRKKNDGVKDPSVAVTKLMTQLGRISFALSELRFSEIGSIVGEDGLFGVRECLLPSFLFQDRRRLAAIPRGPFLIEQAYHHALHAAFVGHASDLSLSHHFFRGPFPEAAHYPDGQTYQRALDRWNDFMTVGDKIDSSDNRVEYHAAGSLVRDILPQLSEVTESSSSRGFPLGHADLSSSNIFVDEDANITCIIDWEFASTMPLAQLLIAPGLPNQREKASPENAAAFRAGFAEAAATAGNAVVSKLVPRAVTDVLWHYFRWINLDTSCDYHHFEVLFGLHPKFADMDPIDVVDALLRDRPEMHEAWRRLAAGDREADEIESDEDTYFAVTDDGDKQRLAAQKLTERFERTRRVMGPEFWMADLPDEEDSDECISSTELSQ
ncbi:hypothetical protein PWT90_10367 [Aphanocladium album]|nr:hypothetical protein PWT90_10367 [Aphanocladium album]